MAERGLSLTGVDASPTMISFCRSRLPDHEWIEADIRGLSLGPSFDGILSWDSFFHLDHKCSLSLPSTRPAVRC
jgi:trans-aconitate methyltransferase